MVLRARWKSAAIAAAAAAALIAAITGCMLIVPRLSGWRFSHRAHTEKRLACDACHYLYETDMAAGMPTNRTCLACHGPSERRESYPFERAIQEKGPEAPIPSMAGYRDLKFSHAIHVGKGVACAECHGEIATSTEVSDAYYPGAPDCEACHRQRGVSMDCVNCHQEKARDVRPPTHRETTWIRNHGKEAAAGRGRGHREACMLCHTRSTCDGCHRIEKPQSHTEFFRIRGHGIAAEIDRDRCSACHQENFCVRCHSETRPRSHHSGSWGGSRANHCLSCHEPIASASCSVCHHGAPSHLLATPIPPPPHPPPVADCYRCHLRPPHADNGSPCTGCHK